MKKNTDYSGLSKDELYLLSRSEYEKQGVITKAFTQKLFKDKKKAANILDKLTRKSRLLQLERGKYIAVPIKAPNQQWSPNEFLVASLWMQDIPYYIGYFTMYNYWGFTEQIPQTVFILNTKKSRAKVIRNIKYQAIKIKENKYYGIQKVEIDGQTVCISDKERTLVDFIYNPIGSFENVEQTLKDNLDKIDLDKFIKYLTVFPVVAVRKRAGYLLEKLGFPELQLEKIKKSIGKGQTYVVLDPTKKSRKGKVNMDWRIIVNR